VQFLLVSQVLAETNQGYMNSLVPLTVKLHCIQEATMDDIAASATTTLSTFATMKETEKKLRHTADAAVLLVVSMGSSCGIAYVNTISSGKTISTCTKSCALGYYVFGHELAHNIGAHHNREVGQTNPSYPSGYGHLIEKGSAATGYRTILAYYAEGHYYRVNYYSNPAVTYAETGTPTGTAESNNAALLTRNRVALAGVGDESACCDCSYKPVLTAVLTPVHLASGVVSHIAEKLKSFISFIFG
jgi:hypothetical protein